MFKSRFWTFAAGMVAAGAVATASKNESVHNGVVRATAACMRAADAVSSATQDVIDRANDINVEARQKAKVDAAVKARMAEIEAEVRAEVEKKAADAEVAE